MKSLIFPLRWSAVVAIVVGVAAVTLLQTVDIFGWAPVRWTSVSAKARETLVFTGPLVCAIVAWTASVNATAVTTLVPGRRWASIVFRHLSVVGSAVVFGFALGLLPAFVVAGMRATSGGPGVVVVVSGFAGLALVFAAGYLVGSLLPAPTGVVAAAVLGFVLTAGLMVLSDAITSAGIPVSLFAVIPFWSSTLGSGSHEVWQIAAFRTVLLTGGAVSLTLLVPLILNARLAGRGVMLKDAARFLGPMFALALVALVVQPAVALPDADPRVSCKEIATGEVCVYEEERAILDTSAEVIADTVGRFGMGALNGKFSSVNEGKHQARPEPRKPGDFFFTPQNIYDEKWSVVSLRYDLLRGVSGVWDCNGVHYERYGLDYHETAPESALEAESFAEFLAAEMARRLDVPHDDPWMLPRDKGTADQPATAKLVATLSRMTDGQLRAWLTEHSAELRGCTARPDEFLS